MADGGYMADGGGGETTTMADGVLPKDVVKAKPITYTIEYYPEIESS